MLPENEEEQTENVPEGNGENEDDGGEDPEEEKEEAGTPIPPPPYYELNGTWTGSDKYNSDILPHSEYRARGGECEFVFSDPNVTMRVSYFYGISETWYRDWDTITTITSGTYYVNRSDGKVFITLQTDTGTVLDSTLLRYFGQSPGTLYYEDPIIYYFSTSLKKVKE